MDGWEMLERAIAIAVKAHCGQRDRAGKPYILHPLRVMARVSTPLEQTVAVLHDVVEDTPWTFDDLRREGFPENIILALDGVTRREQESYEEFVGRSAANPVARSVKLADLEDNMDCRRFNQVNEEELRRFEKYLRAWRRLSS